MHDLLLFFKAVFFYRHIGIPTCTNINRVSFFLCLDSKQYEFLLTSPTGGCCSRVSFFLFSDPVFLCLVFLSFCGRVWSGRVRSDPIWENPQSGIDTTFEFHKLNVFSIFSNSEIHKNIVDSKGKKSRKLPRSKCLPTFYHFLFFHLYS